MNRIAEENFVRTEEPYNYRYGLADDKLDVSAFCCEVERIYRYKAEDVFKVLKKSVTGMIDENDEFPISYINDIQTAILKMDDYIRIKKRSFAKL